ncbi:MAG TPA: trypsin-like serine protease, partial [Candidatus Limnocylindria bacterium]|nr:trypsin-like serine protease [Candidatus Limnocylindria bacterium]
GAVRLVGPTVLSATDIANLEALAGVRVIVEAASPLRLQHTYGGKLMTDPNFGCTSGFTTKDAVSGTTGVLTAGHCFPGDATYWQDGTTKYLADLSGKRWDKNQDFAWYQTSHVESPEFFDGFALRTQTATKPRLEMEGNNVCHSGITTGYSCGLAEDIHYQPPSLVCNGQICDAVWLRVIDSGTPGGAYDIDCAGGDSGGPYFWGHTAWGTHTAGTEPNCTYTVVMTVGALQWDGVNTRILLP